MNNKHIQGAIEDAVSIIKNYDENAFIKPFNVRPTVIDLRIASINGYEVKEDTMINFAGTIDRENAVLVQCMFTDEDKFGAYSFRECKYLVLPSSDTICDYSCSKIVECFKDVVRTLMGPQVYESEVCLDSLYDELACTFIAIGMYLSIFELDDHTEELKNTIPSKLTEATDMDYLFYHELLGSGINGAKEFENVMTDLFLKFDILEHIKDNALD